MESVVRWLLWSDDLFVFIFSFGSSHGAFRDVGERSVLGEAYDLMADEFYAEVSNTLSGS